MAAGKYAGLAAPWSSACVELAHQRKRRDPGLGLPDGINGKDPRSQRQFGAVHLCLRSTRLMSAPTALVALASPVADHVVIGGIAKRAAKAIT